jgi:Leucine-rich repeat (LRR) protein
VNLKDLSDNVISNMPDGIFSDMASLKRLELSHNRLEFIPKDLFKALVRLERLWLNGNQNEDVLYKSVPAYVRIVDPYEDTEEEECEGDGTFN